MSSLLSLYHRLPSGLRSLAASVHGVRLSHLRYGSNTSALAAAAIERERWGSGQWKQWRNPLLRALLTSASENVPSYRDYWRSVKGSKDVLDLTQWPVLEKQQVREDPERFISDLVHRRKLKHTFTSGSTGSPMRVSWSPETAKKWYALVEARWRSWYGVTRFDRWAIIGGKQIIPPSLRKPPFWVFNWGMNQLYMSAYHLSRESVPAYLDALSKYKIKYVHTYTSGVYTLARFGLDMGMSPPPLSVIVTNAEPLFSYQRDVIEKFFNCPVHETYGMAEMVAGAGECEDGNLHIWPDAGYLEVDDGSGELKSCGTGELIATGLINHDMPLIRYRLGDVVTISSPGDCCSCGRSLPILKAVEGRNDDLLRTRDGREIGRLDPVFKSDYPIREAQIIQKTLDLILVKLVPDGILLDSVISEIRRGLIERLGDITVEVQIVDSIPRSANGKFRAVLSEVD